MGDPGHPLFEVVRQELLELVRSDLEKGAVFYDLNRSEPAMLDVYEDSIEDGKGADAALHKRLFVTETSMKGDIQIRQPTIFLDLIPPQTSIAQLPSSIDVEKDQIEAVLTEKALFPFLNEVKEERIKELDIIEEHVEFT